MNYPCLSIITVCFNAESTIANCLNSIAKDKTFDIEYLVIDGASTDKTLDILRASSHFIDKLITEPDAGIFDAMNKGLSLAVGEYVAFLNADDSYLPGAITAILDAIKISQNDADVIYGDWIGVDASGSERLHRSDHLKKWRYSLCHQAMVARRAIFPLPDGFHLKYRLCADYDLIMYWLKSGAHFKRISQPLVYFSEIGASSKNLQKSAVESIVIAVKYSQSPLVLVLIIRIMMFVFRETFFPKHRT